MYYGDRLSTLISSLASIACILRARCANRLVGYLCESLFVHPGSFFLFLPGFWCLFFMLAIFISFTYSKNISSNLPIQFLISPPHIFIYPVFTCSAHTLARSKHPPMRCSRSRAMYVCTPPKSDGQRGCRAVMRVR
ncbi:hypothetical protein EDB19DRAFT_281099 [Suillus lakei]|nr:hypothetical protein EDB19DRAFT_281099 [Suillus lakei]